MLRRPVVQSICASCRLNQAITRARSARLPAQAYALRRPQHFRSIIDSQRSYTTTRVRQNSERPVDLVDQAPIPEDGISAEVYVRKARQRFGDSLPKGYLSEEEYTIYERLYGAPLVLNEAEITEEIDNSTEEVIEEQLPDGSTILLRKAEDGSLEEVEMTEDIEEIEEEVDDENTGLKTLTQEEWDDLRDQEAQEFHEGIYEKTRVAHEEGEEWEDLEEEDHSMRAHPLTIAGRFKPNPSTVFLPKETMVDPTALLLTRANHKHLAESANRIFGGVGLPNSASVAPARLGKEQKAIPLDPSRSDMGNIEADAYMASVQPGTYASVMSALVEVRKRLGSSWLEHLLEKKKGGTILDAGSGGVGVLAWHEILQAEWKRMHEQSGSLSRDETPKGKATVLTGSDTLRHRMSKLLDNTTFIPRLPDTVSQEEEVSQQQPRKLYDLIIAPHTLWPLKQDYQRKQEVERLWSLLNPKGGVLILLEKGLPRGFEVVAGARAHLLKRFIASPNEDRVDESVDPLASELDEDTTFTSQTKEVGMIVAPCTNHRACPMYRTPGVSIGRKDMCFFSQRYIRPPYLQRILGARDRNHENVQFSYLAVQRGRDQRLPQHDILSKGFSQTEETTDAAFKGHEWKSSSNPDPHTGTEPVLTGPEDVNLLTLPRLVLPALKRRGHIILDVCTPSGTLERWTVPRSFSKQAFRDARKARWGDLWALGAKTRIPRGVRLGRPSDEYDKKGRKVKKAKQVVIQINVGEKDGKAVEEGAPTIQGKSGRMLVGDRDGRYTSDRRIRGSGGRKGRKKREDRDILDDM